ncbi:hypothetical protein HOY82DRAFT_215490 [Tuber indicum]|nr:hypothetical protein HOY82DRAFT_215490 [Tuber indicum]
MAKAAISHIVSSMWARTRRPTPPILAHLLEEWSECELTIPSNWTNIARSGINSDVFFTAVMPGPYVLCLSSLTELWKWLGGDWVLGQDSGKLGVKNVLDVRGRDAQVFAWQSIVEAEEERGKDELLERTGKPPPGPGGKAL